ncbi:MFS sugar transporter-like protein [Leptodontidium sp. 2 PMI_412]|nr:MFS sugar transporter-like protein [Leptodontidium sp. 2 PMI_412]
MVPRSSNVISILLVGASSITAATLGFDGSMMNGLNILPSYTDYFELNTTTKALNTASVYLGGCFVCMFYGQFTDIVGRRPALLYAALLTLFAAILQAASQNIAMFVTARVLIGLGTSASSIAGPTYLAETLPLNWRAWGLGAFYDFWYVGGLIAAGVTYGTAQMESTWAWRLPSALQGVFSIVCIAILPFLPESPRWLVHKGRLDEALEVIALTYADGDTANPIALASYREIIDTLNWEREAGETMTFLQMVKTPSSRKRTLLAVSVSVFVMLSGNNIISFYLGTMLDNAGITDSTTQLEINVILNAFCLCVAIGGTACLNKIGRKPLGAFSVGLLAIFIFMIGGLTSAFGESENTAGIYGTVAAIFLFQGSYSFGLTPLTVLYPPEVLNFSIRSNGMALYTQVGNLIGLVVTFTFPYMMEAIGWKTYMINGAWDVLELVFILFFWVETKGKTLEEIDEVLDGTKHSRVPDLEDILRGKADLSNVFEGIDPAAANVKSTSAAVVTTKSD